MSESPAPGFWDAPMPPAWALRALEKGIIDPERFEALVALTAEDALAVRRLAGRPRPVCSCRRRSKRACTAWRFR